MPSRMTAGSMVSAVVAKPSSGSMSSRMAACPMVDVLAAKLGSVLRGRGCVVRLLSVLEAVSLR